MPRAILRADASSSIGMGHIMRCLAFAAGLDKLGIESLFVTRAFDRQFADVIRSNGFDVEEIASDTTAKSDLKLTREFAVGHGAKLIVTDLCHRQTLAEPEDLTSYHKSLASEFFVVALAGDGRLDLPANIVVIPYVGAVGGQRAAADQRMLLLGPSYFIFRPEFIAASEVQRTVNSQGNCLLVTVGGSDELHLTCTILEAVCAIPEPFLNLKVVLGAGYSSQLRNEVVDVLRRFSGSYELLGQKADLAKAMLWADLAIIGDGLTKYEAAVTGTPSIMVCRPDRKVQINWEFAQKGSSLYLGYDCPLETSVIAQQVGQLMGDAALRNEMSGRGKALVDGQGLGRILDHIPANVLC